MAKKKTLGTTDCSECTGACCKRVDFKTRKVYRCQHLADDNSCEIYEDRPIACRLDKRWTPLPLLKAHCTTCQLSEWNRLPIDEAAALKRLLDRAKK